MEGSKSDQVTGAPFPNAFDIAKMTLNVLWNKAQASSNATEKSCLMKAINFLVDPSDPETKIPDLEVQGVVPLVGDYRIFKYEVPRNKKLKERARHRRKYIYYEDKKNNPGCSAFFHGIPLITFEDGNPLKIPLVYYPENNNDDPMRSEDPRIVIHQGHFSKDEFDCYINLEKNEEKL